MLRIIWVFGLALVLFVGGLSGGVVAAKEYPNAVLLKGFWFTDGFLADDPRYMDWQVVAKQPVPLYQSPSLTTSIVGELKPGDRVRVQDIAFEAYPGLQQVRATGPAQSADGKIRIREGDRLGLVCNAGEFAFAFVGEELALVDLSALKLRDQVLPEWRDRLSGANQWLQLWTPEGKAGWAKFYASGSQTVRGRWQEAPNVAGRWMNFNAIVFSDSAPSFQDASSLLLR